MGALSSRQLVIVGVGLVAFGVLILSRGGTTPGLLLLGIGGVMLGKRFFFES